MRMYEIWISRDKEMQTVLNEYRVFKYGYILRILVFPKITSVGSFPLSTEVTNH
jgi:hypothetical protein